MYPALAEAGAGYILSVLSQMNQKTAQDWTELGDRWEYSHMRAPGELCCLAIAISPIA